MAGCAVVHKGPYSLPFAGRAKPTMAGLRHRSVTISTSIEEYGCQPYRPARRVSFEQP